MTDGVIQDQTKASRRNRAPRRRNAAGLDVVHPSRALSYAPTRSAQKYPEARWSPPPLSQRPAKRFAASEVTVSEVNAPSKRGGPPWLASAPRRSMISLDPAGAS